MRYLTKRTLVILVVLCVPGAWTFGLIHVSPAHAEPIAQVGEFGGPGSGAGELQRAGGVAVDQATNDVYVADINGNDVVEYKPSGNSGEFLLMFGKDVDKTTGANICTLASGDTCGPGEPGSGDGEFNNPSDVAVDPATGDVYVDDSTNDRVQRFDPEGHYISQIDSGVAGAPTFYLYLDRPGIAVDSTGDLYLITKESDKEYDHGYVLKLAPDGKYAGVQYGQTTFGSARLEEAIGVAVDRNGFVYVTHNATSSERVVEFSPAGQAVRELPGTKEGAVAVDPRTGDVFVSVPEHEPPEVLEFSSAEGDPANELLTSFGPSSEDFSGGLAYDVAEGKLYGTTIENRGVLLYGYFAKPPKLAPVIESESTSHLAQTAATLGAKVNPQGEETTYQFQYATSSAALPAGAPPPVGAQVQSVAGAPSSSPANTFTSQPVSATAALAPDTSYFYRLLAHSTFGGGAGTTVYGPTQSFATPAEPASVTTGGASAVTQDSALLSGTLTPCIEGAALCAAGVSADTKWCFQYGPSTAYEGGSAPLAPSDAGQGTTPLPVGVQLEHLWPDTLYHYRLVAVNSLGLGLGSAVCGTPGGIETDGADQTFTTTLPPPPGVLTGAASSVSADAATIAGTVDAHGVQSSYAFEIGTDTSYGARIFGNARAGDEAEPFAVSLQALQPGTTYHYRLLASSAYGTSYGADQTFTTPSIPAAVITAPPSPPLIATQPVPFPTEVKTTPATTTTKKKRCKKGTTLKHGRCVKTKKRAKGNGKR